MLLTWLATGLISGAITTGPIDRTITMVTDRTFTLQRVPARAAIVGLPTTYATICKQALDPNDRAPFYIDLAQFLASEEQLGTLDSVSVSAAAASLGLAIDTGARRPAIDTTNDRMELRLTCSDPTNGAFNGEGVYAGLELTFSTGGDLPSTWQKTIALLLRNN